MGEQSSTAELLDAARAGDLNAWSDLDERVREVLHRIMRGRIPREFRARFDTEDLVQSTMLAAWEDIDSFVDRGSGSFAAWLRTIIHRRLIDRIRRYSTARRRPDAEYDASRSAAVEPSYIRAIERADNFSRLVQALFALDRESREIVLSFFFEDQPATEIAERLGLTAQAVRRHLARAILRLRQELRGSATAFLESLDD